MAVHSKCKYTFPVGYHQFHKKQAFNFQLDRWHSLGYARFEDMKEAGGKIRTFADWKRVMRQIDDAQKKLESRIEPAIGQCSEIIRRLKKF